MGANDSTILFLDLADGELIAIDTNGTVSRVSSRPAPDGDHVAPGGWPITVRGGRLLESQPVPASAQYKPSP